MAKIEETQKWGRNVAHARYGPIKGGVAGAENRPEVGNLDKTGVPPVSPAPDQRCNQFQDEKVGDHVDADGWVRGKGKESPYPTFDHGHFDKRKPR
jgi:hypothetical protein